MPSYLFEHPETREVIELVQSINDEHKHIDDDEVEWLRVFTVPNASVDSKNDGTEEGFMRHTKNKKGSFGDIWDASREASEERTRKYGRDEVKEKNEKEYSKKRKGLKRRKKT